MNKKNDVWVLTFISQLAILMRHVCIGKVPPRTSHLVLSILKEVAEKQASKNLRLRKLNELSRDHSSKAAVL